MSRSKHSLEKIQEGVLRFYEKNQELPSQRSGDASKWLGYTSSWGAVDRWLRNHKHPSLFQLGVRLGLSEDPAALHSVEKTRTGILKYYEVHGKLPVNTSGDASSYLGYPVTWNALGQWLRKGHQSSLRAQGVELGLASAATPHSVRAIENGILRYREEMSTVPAQSSGDATKYVGYRTTWSSIGAWLLRKFDYTLAEYCEKMDLRARSSPHTLEQVRKGIRVYAAEHGRGPSSTFGDAVKYVGYKTTWNAIDLWMRREGLGTLSELVSDMGFSLGYAKHQFEAIRDGILTFYDEHRKKPTTTSGEATAYVGYRTTWLAISRWLQKNDYGTLSELCYELQSEGCFEGYLPKEEVRLLGVQLW